MASDTEDSLDDLELLTPDDVERLFKIPKSTQAAMRCRGQIPFILPAPRMPRYSPTALRSWLAEAGARHKARRAEKRAARALIDCSMDAGAPRGAR